MELDDQLVLKILRYVRDNATDQRPLDTPDCFDYPSGVVRYHVKLCVQANFLEEFLPRALSGTIRIRSLTWHGHKYLKANCDC